MENQLQQTGEQNEPLSCENCVHTIRKNGAQDVVVCIPRLAMFSVEESMACELHTLKSKK